MQARKYYLQKCKESGQDPHFAMLCLCSTPLSHDLPSPAELLNGRVHQKNLPAVSKPSFSADGDINVKLQVKQNVQYDKTAQQPLRSLFPEDRIRVFNPASGTGHQALSNMWQIPHVHTWWLLTKVEHFGETVVIFVLLESLFRSEVMKSLTMFQSPTPSRVQWIAKSIVPAVPPLSL